MNRALGLPLVVTCGLLAAGALAALLLLRRREARGGLLPAALALALLTPSCAVGFASRSLALTFEGMAQRGQGGKQVIGPVLKQADTWLLAGAGAMLLVLLIALLGLAAAVAMGRRGDEPPPASGRRLAFLAALALLAPLLAAPLVEHTRQNLELVRLVVFLEKGSPELARAEQRYPVLEFGMASITRRLARGFVLGSPGAGYVCLVLLGVAAAGALASATAAAPRSFSALGLLLLLALSGVACFWIYRLALELRALSSA